MSDPSFVAAIIDDNDDVRAATANLLAANGYRTELYASAEAFLQAAATSKATCLVVDIDLGGMNGLELARRLNTAGLTYPIIFVTANDAEQVRLRAVQIGCVGFLRKPFFAGDLIEAL